MMMIIDAFLLPLPSSMFFFFALASILFNIFSLPHAVLGYPESLQATLAYPSLDPAAWNNNYDYTWRIYK